MPHLEALPRHTDVRLTRCLWQWLILAVLAVACLPMLRTQTAIGFLPLWLLLAPTAALLAAYRQILTSMTLELGRRS